MRYRVCKSFDIESGHLLSKHPSRCRFPHGHSRRIDLVLSSPELDENDMVCDFKALKLAVADYLDRLDHAMVVNSRDPALPALRQAARARAGAGAGAGAGADVGVGVGVGVGAAAETAKGARGPGAQTPLEAGLGAGLEAEPEADPALGGCADDAGRLIILEDTDPTTEVLAREIYRHLEARIRSGEPMTDSAGHLYRFPKMLTIERVRVGETSSSWAEYGV